MVNSITIVGRVVSDPVQTGKTVALKVRDFDNDIDFLCITRKYTESTMQNAKIGRSITVIGTLKINTLNSFNVFVSEIKTPKSKEN